MKRFFILLGLVSATMLMAQPSTSAWNEDYYSRYDYTTYTNYAPFGYTLEASTFDSELLSAAIFYETNRQRAIHGLSQFKFDYNLFVCAHNHSCDMANHQFFSHTSVVPGKTSMSDRFKQVGYTNVACAENIIYSSLKGTYASMAKYLVADSWMNSPGHRANILTPEYNYLGCGTSIGYYKGYIVVFGTQNFLEK